jgi:MarC family membrane protein
MDILQAAITLFLVMDPLGNIPIFLSVLDGIPAERRRKVLVRELFFALGILLLFLFGGPAILDILNLRQESIAIAGGIILFLIALRMIFPGRTGIGAGTPDGEPFIVPLAIPLVAGPSALATLVLLVQSGPGRQTAWLLALLIAWFVTASILMSSTLLYRLRGKRGLIAVERLMGMVLVALAVQMFLDGLATSLK